jgi:hypothetical protein
MQRDPAMECRSGSEGSDRHSALTAEDETRTGSLDDLVRTRPLLAMAGAGTLGAALGGIFFPRLGRLAVVTVAGYVANGLLRGVAGTEIDRFIQELSR